MVVNMGPFSGSTLFQRFLASTIWVAAQHFSVLYLSVPFVFRYAVVCRYSGPPVEGGR